MERIYIDWNILTQIKTPKTEPFISLANRLEQMKAKVTIPYSSAHLLDLKKGYKEQEPNITYTNKDLLFLSEICKNTYWYYNIKEKAVWAEQRTALETFGSYKGNDFSVEESVDFEKLFSDMEGMEDIGRAFNDLLKNIQIPLDLGAIPDDSELKKTLQNIFQTTGTKISLLTLMKNFGKFSDEIHKDPTKYKELRNGFRAALELPKDISNWTNNTWDKLDTHMPLTILNKSFTEMVSESVNQQAKDKGVTFHDEFLHSYMSLDLVGYNPEKLNKKNTYTNFFNDSQHAFFAGYCDVFITNDNNTKAKAKAIYEKYNITTEVLTAEEFLTKTN